MCSTKTLRNRRHTICMILTSINTQSLIAVGYHGNRCCSHRNAVTPGPVTDATLTILPSSLSLSLSPSLPTTLLGSCFMQEAFQLRTAFPQQMKTGSAICHSNQMQKKNTPFHCIFNDYHQLNVFDVYRVKF